MGCWFSAEGSRFCAVIDLEEWAGGEIVNGIGSGNSIGCLRLACGRRNENAVNPLKRGNFRFRSTLSPEWII